MRPEELRELTANKARNYIGAKQGDAKHKEIVDAYNSRLPLPRGHKLTMTDAWCAGFVSAIANMLNLDVDVFPRECSCSELIKLAQMGGMWREDDTYSASVGDLLLYDWQDGLNYACTDNQGAPEHVGIITMVTASSYTVVEGNKRGACGIRVVPFNGRYIRGFITPNYEIAAARWNVDSTSGYRKIIREKAGLAEATLDYLQDYKYGDDLLRKLAAAMK